MRGRIRLAVRDTRLCESCRVSGGCPAKRSALPSSFSGAWHNWRWASRILQERRIYCFRAHRAIIVSVSLAIRLAPINGGIYVYIGLDDHRSNLNEPEA